MCCAFVSIFGGRVLMYGHETREVTLEMVLSNISAFQAEINLITSNIDLAVMISWVAVKSCQLC